MRAHTTAGPTSTGQCIPELRGTRFGDGEWLDDESRLDEKWQYRRNIAYAYGQSNPALRPKTPEIEAAEREMREARIKAERKARWEKQRAKQRAEREAEEERRAYARSRGLRPHWLNYWVAPKPEGWSDLDDLAEEVEQEPLPDPKPKKIRMNGPDPRFTGADLMDLLGL